MTGSVTSLPSLSIAHSGTKHTRTHAGPSQDYIITCCPLHTHSHADAGTSSFRTAAGSTTATHTRHTGGITKQQGCDGSADSRCLRSTPLPTQAVKKSAGRGAERRQRGTDRQRGGKGKGKGEAVARVWRQQPPVVSQRAHRSHKGALIRPRPRTSKWRAVLASSS